MPIRLDDFASQIAAEEATNPPASETTKPLQGIRMDDYASMVDQQRVVEALHPYTPEEQDALKSKGKIGYIEKLRRTRLSSMLPIIPAVNSIRLLSSVRRFQANQFINDEQRDTDIRRINEYLKTKEEERLRGFTIPGQIARGQTDLPSYMLEFALSGGGAGAARSATAA